MQQNIEFERCIDFLVRMIDKYGEEVLREFRLTRNHFMPRIDSYDHAEQRATSKILMSGFHIFIASIKDSKHCCQCTK